MLLPPSRLRHEGQPMKQTHRLASDRPLHRKLQGSNIFDGFSKIDQGRSLLACTTRMFEILIDVTDSVAKPKPAASGSVRTTPVHQSFRTHILAASDYSLFKEQDGFPSKRRRQLSLPSSCFQSVLRPIGEANLIVVFFAVNRVLRIFSGLSKPR